MYSVIDSNNIPILDDKDEAFALLDQLKENNPDVPWLVVASTTQSDHNAMERLYALCHQLLTVSKINPFELRMSMTDLIGQSHEYTAARIMHDARAKLDEV